MSGKKFLTRARAFIIILLAAMFFCILYINNSVGRNDIKSSYSTIKVVLDDNYPPYSFRSIDGILQGVSVDQWRLWESKTGIKVELVTAKDWDTAMNNMKQGKYDVIDNIFYSDERNNIFDFTSGYADIDVCIFYNKNISGILDEKTINGFDAAVKKGDYTEEYLSTRGVKDLVEYNSYEDIIKAAKAGEVSVFVMDEPSALYYLYKNNLNNDFLYTKPLYSNQFHRAVLKGNQELSTTVEKGFSLISKNEYMATNSKWFGTEDTYLKYTPYLLFIAVMAVFIISALLYTAKFLRNKLKEKNRLIYRTEQYYTNLFNSLKVGIAIFGMDRELLLCNPVCRVLFGVEQNTSLNGVLLSDVLNFIVKPDGSKLEYHELNINKVFETGEPIKDFILGIKKNENCDIMWVMADCTPRFGDGGEVESVVITLVDLTERIKASDMLKKSENKTKAIIKAIPDLIFVINLQGLVLEYLSGKDMIVNSSGSYFMNKNIKEIIGESNAAIFRNAIEQVKARGEMVMVEFPGFMEDSCYYEARLMPMEQDKLLVLVRDITERRNSEKKIYDMSMKDITTGLYNRNFFEDMLKNLKEQQTENVGIIICDIDGLKFINDTLGHAEGDNLIKDAAYILKKYCREGDIIARIGGDEFAVIASDTSEEELENYKRKIIEAAEELNALEPVIPVSMSAGYSFSGSGRDLHQLFKEADTFMYREKLHHHQSKRSKNIEIMTKMLAARDFITEGHGERMQNHCVQLARAIGMSDAKIGDIILFAQFHDIGKVGIPDAILFKPGKLNLEEQEEMMRHTEIGYRIAESSPDIVHISEWILKHHERWDGKGYPHGLKGEEIPVECRILSIVDAYDAMTNERPYRKALSSEFAVEEIKRCAGSQFDPYLVERFLSIL